jgi:hypothetical protein
MADSFEQSRQFYRALEQAQQQELARWRMPEYLVNEANRAMELGKSFAQERAFAAEQFHFAERNRLCAQEQLSAATERAMQCDRERAALQSAREFAPKAYDRELMARLKPSAAELQMHLDRQSSVEAAYQAVRSLIPPESMVSARMAQEEMRWHKSMDGVLAQRTRAELMVSSVQRAIVAQEMSQLRIAASLKDFAVFDKSDALADRLMRPQYAYAHFASRTAECLAGAQSAVEASAYRASLRLAEMQLLTTTDALSRAVGTADFAVATPVLEREPLIVVPRVQQQELLESGIEFADEDSGAAIKASPTAQTAELAGSVLLLVTQCNEASKIAGGSDIFKPTNRMLEAFARLPWGLATDKEQLGDIVDCLFWTLYEGAGDEKLRFLKDYGGWMDAAECDEVFRIKFLRNKWLRHDPDHGKESKIVKGWEDVTGAIRELGLQGLPVTEADHRLLHRRMLEQIEVFLQKLLLRISGRGN